MTTEEHILIPKSLYNDLIGYFDDRADSDGSSEGFTHNEEKRLLSRLEEAQLINKNKITMTTENWIPVEQQLPDHSRSVLTTDGKVPRICSYAHPQTIVVDNDDDDEPNDLDCFEDEGECYLKPGWYELEECYGGYYDEVWMSRKVTHWQPLPEPPKSNS